jgi:hypothetical protein
MAIGTLAAIGLGAGAIGSVLSSKSNRKAATTAANAQVQSSAETNALARDIYGQNRAALSPFLANASPAGANLNAFLGMGTAEEQAGARGNFRNFLYNSDYGFQLDEGGNALNSGYAGAGTLRSGAAMKDLERFRQNLQQGYRGEWMNGLANQQGVGLGAASALAGVGQNYVNTVGATNANAADALSNAALIKGQNNPLANAIGLFGGGLFGMAR